METKTKTKTILLLNDGTKLSGIFGGLLFIYDDDTKIPLFHSVRITVNNQLRSIKFDLIKEIEIEEVNHPALISDIESIASVIPVRVVKKIED